MPLPRLRQRRAKHACQGQCRSRQQAIPDVPADMESGQIFSAYFDSREKLSSFYGYLTAGTSLLMFPIEAFLLSRIIGRIGLGNASMIFSFGTLGISGLLIAFPTSVVAASLAYFDRKAFRFGIRETSNDLLYNAVPLRVKGRSRAFINGLVVPIGLLLSSGMIWLLRVAPGNWVLPALLGGSAIAFMTCEPAVAVHVKVLVTVAPAAIGFNGSVSRKVLSR